MTVYGQDHDHRVLGCHELKRYDDARTPQQQTGTELGKLEDIAPVQALNDCISSHSVPFVEGDETWQEANNAADVNGEKEHK